MLYISDAIKKYNDYLVSEETPETTINSQISAIQRFAKWSSFTYIEDIPMDFLVSYKPYLRNQGAGGNTINTYVSYLKSFFTLLLKMKYIEVDFREACTHYKGTTAKTIKGARQQKYDKEEKKFISPEYQQKMYEAAADRRYGERDKLMIETAFTCGLRRFEIVNLKVCDINFKKSSMTIIGKGNKERDIPILKKKYLNDLSNYIKSNKLDEDDYVFLTQLGTKMTEMGFDKIFREILEAAKLPCGRENNGFTTHDMRGTYISALLDAGMFIQDVAEIVGHDDPKVTMLYHRKHHADNKFNDMKEIMAKADII